MMRRILLALALLSVSAPPASANAEPICVPVPVDTIGVEVQVDDVTVHVPAISDATLCAEVTSGSSEALPVHVEVLQGCGFPCFRVVVDGGHWSVAGGRFVAYLSYEQDGVPMYTPLVDLPFSVGVDNVPQVCVAAGNPIPECPPDGLVIPIPI